MKPIVLFGLLGTVLDAGKNSDRWNRWRPSVAVCQQSDLLIHKYYLIYSVRYNSLADKIEADIRQVSPETQMIKCLIDFKDPWDFEEVYGKLYDLSKNMDFNPNENEYLFHITTGTHVAQICIFLLTESRHFPCKLLQTAPEHGKTGDTKGSYTIINLDLSKYDKISARFNLEEKNDISFLKSGIETKNPHFNLLIEQIEQVAVKSREPILLTGPTGAGKSQLARRIYELKKNRSLLNGNFIEVNCATLRGDAAMSALFGHKKGAYTGAIQDRPGLLKQADQGIIFLDEIGELGNDEQAMLLQAIETKRFLSVGADTETESEFQIICGTNKDLQKEIINCKFREDLLARINLWTFMLPGLAERKEDIEPNLEYELKKFERENNRHVTFSQEAKDRFMEFALSCDALWCANFRDLNAAVKRMCTLSSGGRITTNEVTEEIIRLKNNWPINTIASNHAFTHIQTLRLPQNEMDLFDCYQLEGVIETCRQSRTISEAGRKLFAFSMQERNSTNDADRLNKYLARFGLKWQNIKSM